MENPGFSCRCLRDTCKSGQYVVWHKVMYIVSIFLNINMKVFSFAFTNYISIWFLWDTEYIRDKKIYVAELGYCMLLWSNHTPSNFLIFRIQGDFTSLKYFPSAFRSNTDKN